MLEVSETYCDGANKKFQQHGESIKVLLITANVGSLFEDPDRLLQPWMKEVLQKVLDLQPQFFALHLQEVGGKTYEKSIDYVQEFIKCLLTASEMKVFECIHVYVDEDYKSPEHFTALGNFYFIHKNIECLKIWDFSNHCWKTTENKNIYTGNIETVTTKEKAKFPQHFFPECKWSRKGFMRTRWEVNGTAFDLVNIHLFHDASNIVASEKFPSVYCKTRRRALVHTLEKFHTDDKNGFVPYFVFGDFNFRCDTAGVIKALTDNLSVHRVHNVKNDSTKIHYRNSLGDNILSVGKKEFYHADHQVKFKDSWLKYFDKEQTLLNDVLVEYPIVFPPSYPYEEDPNMPTDYMCTRCPSWCDRVLMGRQVEQIVSNDGDIVYNVIGENVCMGDHKPIFLNIRLKANQGIVSKIIQLPENLENCILATAADDPLWKDQSIQYIGTNSAARSHYIQISIISNKNVTEKGNIHSEEKEQELENKESVTILKETTV